MKQFFPNQSRKLQILVAGRAGIDLNTMDINCSFKDITGYTKSVGGSPANIAQGLAKLGIRTGFIGKVAGNGMGEYIAETFEKMAVDREGMILDKTGAPNCIAMTYILSPTESGSFFYRNGTADLLITPEEISEDYIANASAVVLSGTAFSLSPSREAMFQIIEYAKRNDTKIIMDIDYRPFGWSSKEETAEVTNEALEDCDIIIGNREEFDTTELIHMPGNRDNAASASYYLTKNAKLVIIKDGANGSIGFQRDEEPVRCGIIKTKSIKTFGSGDAYAAGLIYGLLEGFPVLDAMRFGSACASITLQSVSCAEGMPFLDQVNRYLAENKFTE